MSDSNQYQKEMALFPAVLRDLVAAELAAGNAILEISNGFPAAACGARVRLAREVTSRPRRSSVELIFYDRDNSRYLGTFTYATGYFFILEPPRPKAPLPEMDAIREAFAARERASNCDRESPADRAAWDARTQR